MADTPKARLEALGYTITKKGRLVRKDCTSKGFRFTTQEEYEKVGDAVTAEVQRRMKEELGLVEHWLPDKRYKGTGCNVFASPNILESKAPLLVLICGKGPIEAGLWGRSLCINDDLDAGSMLPDIRRAQALGWSVLVMNPNRRLIDPAVKGKEEEEEEVERFYFDDDGESEVFDPFYDDNEFLRAEFAWRKFVVPSKAQRILVMGHSYGGAVATYLFDLDGVAAKILPRVGGVAIADSGHDSLPHSEGGRRLFMSDQDVVCNWVRSPTNPLDAPEASYDGVKCVSAGHKKHEYTIVTARESMWKFLIERSTATVPVTLQSPQSSPAVAVAASPVKEDNEKKKTGKPQAVQKKQQQQQQQQHNQETRKKQQQKQKKTKKK